MFNNTHIQEWQHCIVLLIFMKTSLIKYYSFLQINDTWVCHFVADFHSQNSKQNLKEEKGRKGSKN